MPEFSRNRPPVVGFPVASSMIRELEEELQALRDRIQPTQNVTCSDSLNIKLLSRLNSNAEPAIPPENSISTSTANATYYGSIVTSPDNTGNTARLSTNSAPVVNIDTIPSGESDNEPDVLPGTVESSSRMRSQRLNEMLDRLQALSIQENYVPSQSILATVQRAIDNSRESDDLLRTADQLLQNSIAFLAEVQSYRLPLTHDILSTSNEEIEISQPTQSLVDPEPEDKKDGFPWITWISCGSGLVGALASCFAYFKYFKGNEIQ